MNKTLGRSIGAILAGFLSAAIVTTLVDVVLHSLGVYPPWGITMSDPLFVAALVYRIAFNTAGCYLTARLAPHHPLQHALIIGAVGTAVGIAGVFAMGDKGPLWYALANVVIAFPCAWAGGAFGKGVKSRVL